jgi:hypothetical protein
VVASRARADHEVVPIDIPSPCRSPWCSRSRAHTPAETHPRAQLPKPVRTRPRARPLREAGALGTYRRLVPGPSRPHRRQGRPARLRRPHSCAGVLR